MKAVITFPDKTVREIDSDLATILELSAKSGCAVFIPACLCDTPHACAQHPRGVIRKYFRASVPEIIG